MNKTLKLAIGAVLVGAATLASAQTQSRAQAFADQFKQMQSLQSVGTYTFKPAPTVRNKPDDPVQGQSFSDTFAQMQSLQDTGTNTFKPASVLSARAADPVGKESFADTFARMQAESSNSGEFKLPPGHDAPAFATVYSVNVAKPASKPSTQEPVASLRNGGSTAPSAN
jgi:hypothetical protein